MRPQRVAWGIWALSVGLLAAAQVLTYLMWDVTLPEDNGEIWAYALFNLLMLAFPAVGLLIVLRQPHNRIGRLCLALGLLMGVFAATDAWASHHFHYESLPLGSWAGMVSQVASKPALLGILLLVLIFPTGRVPTRRWNAVALAIIGLTALQIVRSMVGQADLDTSPDARNPTYLPALDPFFAATTPIEVVLFAVSLVGAVASLVVRFRHAHGIERQQLRWFIAVALLSTLGTIATTAALLAAGINEDFVGSAIYILIVFTPVVGFPVAIGIAVLRYRLYDLDRVINRTLVYALLSAVSLATYFGIVIVLGSLLRAMSGEDSPLVVAASTLAVAALFRPMRGRIQSTVDRRFYRRKYDAAQTLEQFSARLRDEIELGTLTSELSALVEATMQPRIVSIWLTSANHRRSDTFDSPVLPSPGATAGGNPLLERGIWR